MNLLGHFVIYSHSFFFLISQIENITQACKTQNALAFMTIFHCLISYHGSLALAIGFTGTEYGGSMKEDSPKMVFLQH